MQQPSRAGALSAQVRALVDVQREIAAERGVAEGEAFNEDEADLVRGALSLSSKLVVDGATEPDHAPRPSQSPTARARARTRARA